MARTRGVIFDFYGTLVRMVAPLPPSHASVFDRHGLGVQGARWGDQWSVGPADGEEHTAHSASEQAYHTWELDRLKTRARGCGVPAEQLEGLAADLDAATKDMRLAVYEDVRATLADLRRRGQTVALCSNWFWDLEGAVAAVGLTGLFDVVVTSAQAGARKPHPLIYRTALEGCGLRAEEALFVGDAWGPDVEGPLAAGMRAAHLCRPDGAVDFGEAPPLRDGAARITSLRALTALL
ncbi:HAD family hydrolase [Streptomyces sp. NRRL WC-3742]|uniref:HAD family hydrolase n=1 Tax=Streptomyces sp. NRRL WC-3742 TaxID=1463934 RepID=UPI0004CA852F|nr:HAD family hydrolase [Streptomyces sp. NRRL WC-3742]